MCPTYTLFWSLVVSNEARNARVYKTFYCPGTFFGHFFLALLKAFLTNAIWKKDVLYSIDHQSSLDRSSHENKSRLITKFHHFCRFWLILFCSMGVIIGEPRSALPNPTEQKPDSHSPSSGSVLLYLQWHSLSLLYCAEWEWNGKLASSDLPDDRTLVNYASYLLKHKVRDKDGDRVEQKKRVRFELFCFRTTFAHHCTCTCFLFSFFVRGTRAKNYHNVYSGCLREWSNCYECNLQYRRPFWSEFIYALNF